MIACLPLMDITVWSLYCLSREAHNSEPLNSDAKPVRDNQTTVSYWSNPKILFAGLFVKTLFKVLTNNGRAVITLNV